MKLLHALVLSLLIPVSVFAQAPDINILDYIISDVCVDATDKPISGDPAVCTNHRNLKFGEFVPYLRVAKHYNTAQIASTSYPAEASDGAQLVMKSMEYGNGANTVNSSFNDWNNATPQITATHPVDSFDIYETTGNFVSIIATQNGSGTTANGGDATGFQRLWDNNCNFSNDPWPVFPTNGYLHTTPFLFNYAWIAPTCTLPQAFAPVYTTWTPEAFLQFTYDSGKMLDTAISYHWDASTPAQANNLEMFYYTKEYGNARWEAWNTVGPEDPYGEGNCNGKKKMTAYAKTWYRVACHDWTYTISSPKGIPFNPLTNPNGKERVFSKNLLQRGDFSRGEFAPHWIAWGAAQLTTVSDPATLNYNANFVRGSNPSDNSFYQDVDMTSVQGLANIRLGGVFKASTQTSATMVAFLIRPNNTIYAVKSYPISVGTSWAHSDAVFAHNFTTEPLGKIRFQVYVDSPTAVYSVDDVYLTPSRQ